MRGGVGISPPHEGKTETMTLAPHIALLALLTCGIGYLMAVAGIQKSALEWRRRHRTCPSCGRTLDARVCRTCAG
jgi:hypothetical protein